MKSDVESCCDTINVTIGNTEFKDIDKNTKMSDLLNKVSNLAQAWSYYCQKAKVISELPFKLKCQPASM